VADHFPSQIGTNGAGNRAVRLPAFASRPPRRPRPANDNRMPRRELVMQGVRLVLLLVVVAALVWGVVS